MFQRIASSFYGVRFNFDCEEDIMLIDGVGERVPNLNETCMHSGWKTGDHFFAGLAVVLPFAGAGFEVATDLPFALPVILTPSP